MIWQKKANYSTVMCPTAQCNGWTNVGKKVAKKIRTFVDNFGLTQLFFKTVSDFLDPWHQPRKYQPRKYQPSKYQPRK